MNTLSLRKQRAQGMPGAAKALLATMAGHVLALGVLTGSHER